MLCSTDAALTLRRPGWLYELKFDGARVLAQKTDEAVVLMSRSGRAVTAGYPEIAHAVRALPAHRAILDGEILAFDERGLPSFARLARRIQAAKLTEIRSLVRQIPCVVVAFDLLALEGHDLRSLPLHARKRLLEALVRGAGTVRTLDPVEDDGTALYEFCIEHNLEGIVAKKADSPYRTGPARSPDWVKLKREREDDFVVVGWTHGQGARASLGALDIASFDGDSLVVRGKVGAGLDREGASVLLATLEPLAVPTPTPTPTPAAAGEFEHAPHGRVFVKPCVVVNVRYQGWTPRGRLRCPVLRGIRDDVRVEACKAGPPELSGAMAVESEAMVAEPISERASGARSEVPSIRITHREKPFWPDDGITKGHLCDYYAEIADALLPYLRERPIVLVRYPDGVRGEHFFQWHAPPRIPSWMRTVDIDRGGKKGTGFLVDNRESLLYIVNLGVIPIHILARRIARSDECDFATFDFDVQRATLRDGIVLARSLHEILSAIGLDGFPKTSGQTGLHVLVPLGPGVSFVAARNFVELIAHILHARHAQISTLERRIADRGEGVYIDTGQTGVSRTIVAPYSVRAYPGATVSTPLSWNEVGPALDPRRFDIFTVPERVRQSGDPMRHWQDTRPNLSAALGALEKLVLPAVPR